MFDELAIINGSRLMLLAGASYTLWSLHGVFLRSWSVGTLFFWMWWEMLLSSVSTTILIHRWWRRTTLPLKGDKAAGVAGISALMLFFMAMFTCLALGTENISVQKGTLGDFLRARGSTMALIACLFLLVHLMTAHGRRFTETPNQQLMRPLLNRMFPVLGIYAVSIIDYHWHGSRELDTSHTHQLLMAGSLLGVKLVLELRQWFKAG